jgi:DNA polymerase-4
MERRLHRAGIYNLETFWNIQPKRARKIWGSVAGERFWYALHGVDITCDTHAYKSQKDNRRSIGHSQVLAPQIRTPLKARLIARALTVKASSRLRRMNYHASRISLYVKIMNVKTMNERGRNAANIPSSSQKWHKESTCPPCQDNFTFLSALEHLWDEMILDINPRTIRHVGITLGGLCPSKDVMPDLFSTMQDPLKSEQVKHDKISTIMDQLNARYGRGTITVGIAPEMLTRFSGAKIAFNRIPDQAEFNE